MLSATPTGGTDMADLTNQLTNYRISGSKEFSEICASYDIIRGQSRVVAHIGPQTEPHAGKKNETATGDAPVN